MVEHIFVSHSHNDNEFGIKLARDLRRILGDDAVWYDVERGLQPGDPWWDKILEKLTECDVFLIIVSSDAMASRWVKKELNIALNEEKRIIPLFYRECQVRADIKTIQGISFLPPYEYEETFNKLLLALGWSVVSTELEFPVQQQERGKNQKTKNDYVNEGRAYRKIRQYEAALKAYNHALELDPHDAYTYGGRGDVYRALRKYELALQDFNHAFELNPESATAWAYATRGRVYMGMKEYQKACDDFDRAYEMAPKDTWVNKWRNEAYEKLKRQ